VLDQPGLTWPYGDIDEAKSEIHDRIGKLFKLSRATTPEHSAEHVSAMSSALTRCALLRVSLRPQTSFIIDLVRSGTRARWLAR